MRLFNSNKVNYHPKGLVLEIACGKNPAPDTDVALEPSKNCIEDLKKNWPGLAIEGNALNLPFKDKSFDYVINMHLLEHFEEAEILKFCSEVKRVASRGYIEVPSIYWELLHNCDKEFQEPTDKFDIHHKQYCFYYEGILYFIKKHDDSNIEHKILRTLFRNIISPAVVGKNIDLFMIGLEWNNEIPISFHSSLEELPNDLLTKINKNIIDYINNNPSQNIIKEEIKKYFKNFYKKIYSRKKVVKKINPLKILKNGIY